MATTPGRIPLWAFPLASILLAGLAASGILLFAPQWWAASAGLAAAYLVTPLGQEVWLGLGQVLFHLPLALVALLILIVNCCVSLVCVAVPLEALVARLPRLGGRIARFEARVRSHRAARRGIAVAVAVLIALPFHSGGAILGSLGARALGLTPGRAFLAVATGVATRLCVATVLVAGGLALLQ